MKKKELALCDLDSDYITMFASYLLAKYSDINLHIYTTPESYFSDEIDFDVAIMTEDFDEVSSFKKSGVIKKKYILKEDRGEQKENHIFKYQSMDLVLSKIDELKKGRKENSGTKSNGKTSFIGVYSPIQHELQLPFSMALSQSYEDFGSVLFLDIEELSIMASLIGVETERNLMDYLYEISTQKDVVDIKGYVNQFMGFDYISPFVGPDEVSQIDDETWLRLFTTITKMNYDTVVVLFGRAVNGFPKILEQLDRFFVLGRPGDYFKRGQDAFFNYLEKNVDNQNIEEVILPMSASNLSEGTYCIEELMQGNLGLFVRKLLSKPTTNELVVA